MSRFRIPDGWRPRMPDLDRLRDREWRGPRRGRPRRLHGPDMDRLRDREWRRPRWLLLPSLGWLRMPELDVPAHMLVPGMAVILLLFGGGLYFGNMLGSDPSAASLITTVTLKGKVTVETVKGKRVKVTLRPRTITRHKTVTRKRGTLDVTQTQLRTHTQLVPVPTTITRTATITRTQTVTTTTVSVTTVTVPSS
jgi:hypothetical protein